LHAQRVFPLDVDVEGFAADAHEPRREGAITLAVAQRGSAQLTALERGQDADHRDARAQALRPAPGCAERVAQLRVHGAEGPPGERRWPGVDLEIEAIDLEREALVRHARQHLMIDQRWLAIGVNQIQLQLRADRGGPLAEAGPLRQQL
jgi:hypothetical protein